MTVRTISSESPAPSPRRNTPRPSPSRLTANAQTLRNPAIRTKEPLRIFTLGRFRVVLPEHTGGGEPAWSHPQSRTLLKCLVASPGHHLTSEQAIELLWPEGDPDSGRERLRDTLSKLRRALEPGRSAYHRSAYVLSDRASLRLIAHRQDEDADGVWLDADAFEHTAEAALAVLETGGDAHRITEAALALYHGPFLPMDRYSDWSRAPRQRYERLWSALVRRLAHVEAAARHLDRALRLLDRLIDIMPDDEDAIYLSMAIHAHAGRRGEALRIYQGLRTHLADTLGAQPMRELRLLSEAIRAGDAMDAALSRRI